MGTLSVSTQFSDCNMHIRDQGRTSRPPNRSSAGHLVTPATPGSQHVQLTPAMTHERDWYVAGSLPFEVTRQGETGRAAERSPAAARARQGLDTTSIYTKLANPERRAMVDRLKTVTFQLHFAMRRSPRRRL